MGRADDGATSKKRVNDISGRQKAYSFEDDGRKDHIRKKPKGKQTTSSSSSSTSSDSEEYPVSKRTSKLSDGRDRRNSADGIDTAIPDFTQRPTTRATRPPVRMQIDPEIYIQVNDLNGTKWPAQ